MIEKIIDDLLAGEHADIIIHVLFVCMGYFVAMCISYLKFGNEISFIKGQLSLVLDAQQSIAKLIENSVIMERDLTNAMRDLDEVFLRVKVLEGVNIN